VAEITVDGVARSELLRQGEGSLWVPLERGVHRIELNGSLAAVDSLDLRFPPPRPGWSCAARAGTRAACATGGC